MNASERMKLEAQLAELKKGDQLNVKLDDHHMLNMLTNEDGIHSGRPRYLVVCVTCEVLLHEATTGPIERMILHANGLYRNRPRS